MFTQSTCCIAHVCAMHGAYAIWRATVLPRPSALRLTSSAGCSSNLSKYHHCTVLVLKDQGHPACQYTAVVTVGFSIKNTKHAMLVTVMHVLGPGRSYHMHHTSWAPPKLTNGRAPNQTPELKHGARLFHRQSALPTPTALLYQQAAGSSYIYCVCPTDQQLTNITE